MGWRFRRSIKILPGIRLNFGKKGISSTTIGGKYFKTNVSGRGVRHTVSAPGTGLSYSTPTYRGSSTMNDSPSEDTPSVCPPPSHLAIFSPVSFGASRSWLPEQVTSLIGRLARKVIGKEAEDGVRPATRHPDLMHVFVIVSELVANRFQTLRHRLQTIRQNLLPSGIGRGC